MRENNLLEKVKKAGFGNLDDFIKANLHYLPESRQRLFYLIEDISNISYQQNPKKTIRLNYQGAGYYGKG